MADAAIRSILTVVFIFMTCNTLSGYALIDTISMTGFAFKLGMMPDQWECGIVVIEGYISPSTGIVAGAAVCAKLTVVVIFCGMARITICGRAFIYAVGMAGSALDIVMFPG